MTMEQHRHAEDGTIVLIDEPAAVEAIAEAETTEVVAEASVEIARVEAERDVALAKESTKQTEVYANDDLARLQGEVVALRELVESLKPPEPEPAPAPVVVEAPPVEEPTEPEPPVVDHKPAAKKSSGLGWF